MKHFFNILILLVFALFITTMAQAQCAVCTKTASQLGEVGSSRVDLQACKLEYSIVSPK